MEQKPPPLHSAIAALYPEPLPDDQAQEAARNLRGFFELLIAVDKEMGREASRP